VVSFGSLYGAALPGGVTKQTKWSYSREIAALTDDVNERTYVVNGDSYLVSKLETE
jgi:hypothetical protein